MKKLPVIAVFILMILITGCSKPKGKVPADITSKFSALITVQHKEAQYEAKLTRTAPGMCKIEITKPLLMKGMTLEYQGGTIHMSYLGLRYEVTAESMPNSAFFQAIVKALDAVGRIDDLDIKKKKGQLVISGKTDAGPFTLEFNDDKGEIASLSMPSVDLIVKFSEFSKQ